ncbi:MAG: hypothetical protein ACR2NX_08485 [Chthoniobacterales bacterium]
MTALDSSDREALARLAQRLVWWKNPAEALADPDRFLAQLMTFGTWNDLQEATRFWPEDQFRSALRRAPAGVFDRRSWAYWHHRLDLLPVPPLPTRKLPKN